MRERDEMRPCPLQHILHSVGVQVWTNLSAGEQTQDNLKTFSLELADLYHGLCTHEL